MAKLKTLSEAESARRRAITGLRNLGRDEEAERYESMSARDYAEEKGVELVENPFQRSCSMARQKTPAELRAEIAELKDQVTTLEDENEDLQSQIDEIAQIAGGDVDTEEDSEEEEGDEDDLD
jgi:hypothetical protein